MTKERISYRETPEGVYKVMRQVEAYIRESGMDLKLLELLKYRVSQINHCAYCLDMHYKEAIHYGEEPLRLYSVSAWREAPYYTEKERAALELAETLTYLPDRHVEDPLFEKLSGFFSKSEIACLTLAIAQINSWNRLMQCFGSEPGKYEVKTR